MREKPARALDATPMRRPASGILRAGPQAAKVKSTSTHIPNRPMSRNPTDIDRLYGLEPVFEPGAEPGSDALVRGVDVDCPYCGETIGVTLDLSAGSQSYIEDCQVCCQPIELSILVGDDGELDQVDAARLDR